jgi:hypothetical protein
VASEAIDRRVVMTTFLRSSSGIGRFPPYTVSTSE